MLKFRGMAGIAQLLLGRHGPNDHYLGGRYRRAGRAPRQPRALAFPLGPATIHLFEFIARSQRREPVAPGRIFPSFSSRYELTALAFARCVESAGGKSYNAESRPSAALDRQYAELHDAAMQADLAFFKLPLYTRYLALIDAEDQFGSLRQGLIEGNVTHFTSYHRDVVARLGRVHSRVRRLARQGVVVVTRIGAGSFFPEQVLKRRSAFGLPVREEDRMRGYIDRLLRLAPLWDPALELPSHALVLSLAGAQLDAVRAGFEAAAEASRALPHGRDLLRILGKTTGRRALAAASRGDPRFARLRARDVTPRG
jgi:hypothetical protein